MPAPGRRAAAALPCAGTWSLTRGEGSSPRPLRGCLGAGTRALGPGGCSSDSGTAPANPRRAGGEVAPLCACSSAAARPRHRHWEAGAPPRPERILGALPSSSVRGPGGLLRRGLVVCRAPPRYHRRGRGLCERRLRSPPVMDGDRVEIDGGIMEGVSTSGGLASPYLAPGSGDGQAGSGRLGGKCRSA